MWITREQVDEATSFLIVFAGRDNVANRMRKWTAFLLDCLLGSLGRLDLAEGQGNEAVQVCLTGRMAITRIFV